MKFVKQHLFVKPIDFYIMTNNVNLF